MDLMEMTKKKYEVVSQDNIIKNRRKMQEKIVKCAHCFKRKS